MNMSNITSGFVNPAARHNVSVLAQNGGFHVTVREVRQVTPDIGEGGPEPRFVDIEASIFVDPARVPALPDICAGYLAVDDTIQLVWDSEKFHTRDAASSVAERLGIPDITKSRFVVGFSETGAYLTACAPLRETPTGAAFEPLAVNNTPRDWLREKDPAIAASVDKARAKRPLLARVNTIDTVAELEKQVDLLSTLVVALVDALPEANRPAWYPAFKVMLASGSSTQFKSEEACIADVSGIKNSIRQLQSTYFNIR